MNLTGLYSLLGIIAVFVVFFLVKSSRPAANRNTVSNHKEDESEHMSQQNNPIASVNSTLMDDNELIAVISAAIAASMGTQSNIVVRSIRRVYDPTPVWAKTGRTDVMSNRF